MSDRGLGVAGHIPALLGLGFVSGMAVERMRFDRQRQVIVGRLAERTDRVHAHLMALERTVAAP